MGVVGSGGEDFAALVEVAELDDVDIDITDAPVVHLTLAWEVNIDGSRADQCFAVVVYDKQAVDALHAKFCAEWKA